MNAKFDYASGTFSNAPPGPVLTIETLMAAAEQLEAACPTPTPEMLEEIAVSMSRWLKVPLCAGAERFGRVRLVPLEWRHPMWFALVRRELQRLGIPPEVAWIEPARSHVVPT